MPVRLPVRFGISKSFNNTKKGLGGHVVKHFKPHEFNCKCGHCGLGFDDMEPNLLAMIDEARDSCGVPFVITSAIRCGRHNLQVGGSSTSSHLSGLALDIKCDASFNRFKMIEALIGAGFKRIGIAKDFIHVDIDPDKPVFVTWLY